MEIKKKILIIENSLYVTGAFNAIFNLTQKLRSNFDFIYAIPERSQIKSILEKESYLVYEIKKANITKSPRAILYPYYLYRSARQLINIYKKENCLIVHLNDFTNLNGALAKILYAKINLIYHIRLLKSSYIRILHPFFSTSVLYTADKVIAVSKAVLNDLPERNNITQVYDIVTPEKISEQWDGLKKTSEMKILYLGNYTPGKNQHEAIEGFNLFLKLYPKAQLHFYGNYDLIKMKNYKIELKNRVKTLNIDENVYFNGKSKDVENLMKKFDVVLNLSLSESFSLVTIESILYGVPIVVYNSGGPKEITENGKRAILLEDFKPATISTALENIANNPEKYKRLAKNSQLWAQEKFLEEISMEKMRLIYNEV